MQTEIRYSKNTLTFTAEGKWFCLKTRWPPSAGAPPGQAAQGRSGGSQLRAFVLHSFWQCPVPRRCMPPHGLCRGNRFLLMWCLLSSLSGSHEYQQPVSIEYVFLAHILSQTVLTSHFKSWENPSSNSWEVWKQKGRPVTWLIWIISQGHRESGFPGDQSILSTEEAFPPGAPCSPAAPSGLHVPEIWGLLGGDRSCLGGCHGV